MAQYLIEILGDKLDLSNIKSDETGRLPSPEMLKGKILVKVTFKSTSFTSNWFSLVREISPEAVLSVKVVRVSCKRCWFQRQAVKYTGYWMFPGFFFFLPTYTFLNLFLSICLGVFFWGGGQYFSTPTWNNCRNWLSNGVWNVNLLSEVSFITSTDRGISWQGAAILC